MPTSTQVQDAVARYAAAVASADKAAIMACYGNDPRVTVSPTDP
jgi:ketosteroid isomerase-like protein